MNGRDNGRINWQTVAVWVTLALLGGAWGWVRSEQAVSASDHDAVVSLQTLVPEISRRLERLEAQNEEILRRLPKEDL